MITATVRYKLPAHIDKDACRAHFHKIAPGFREAKGLISKHFIWSESGWASGVYQWRSLEDAKAFFEDEVDPNPMTHRVGPFLAYRFYSEPRGSTMFNEPTIILIVNWWLSHRYRTGEDVSQAVPYIVLGFLFNGETLFGLD